jgi:hypothetical protein
MAHVDARRTLAVPTAGGALRAVAGLRQQQSARSSTFAGASSGFPVCASRSRRGCPFRLAQVLGSSFAPAEVGGVARFVWRKSGMAGLVGARCGLSTGRAVAGLRQQKSAGLPVSAGANLGCRAEAGGAPRTAGRINTCGLRPDVRLDLARTPHRPRRGHRRATPDPFR